MMIYRALGMTGMQVSALGLGTWPLSGTLWGGTDKLDAMQTIRYALDHGINLIDTAPLYGFGKAEEWIAQTLNGHPRETIIIADKIGLTWRETEGRKFREIEGHVVYQNLHPDAIRAEVDGCLQRLHTDYLDLCITNAPDPTTPVADTIGTLLELKAAGKVRAIGVSNVTMAQLQEYLAAGQVDAVEQPYHMLNRRIEHEMLPFCKERDIAILGYSVLGQGLLTGTMIPRRQFAPGDQRGKSPRFSMTFITHINAMLDQFITLREKYGLNQTQLTIAWAISRPGITCSLAGARTPGQMADLIPGGSTIISNEDLQIMDHIIEEFGPDTRRSKAA
jgi:aryl-alcohol dehydrogenase-like predicted oxidoreductase